MRTDTKYFGQVDYEEDDVLQFESGFFGFEAEKQFLLLPFAGSNGTLLCFQSLTTPQLAFVAMNPFSLKADYAPVLSKEELRDLGAAESTELCYFVLCVVREPVAQSTVNLKCPVAVNEDARRAAQIILEEPDYEMRHPLSAFGKEGAAC